MSQSGSFLNVGSVLRISPVFRSTSSSLKLSPWSVISTSVGAVASFSFILKSSSINKSSLLHLDPSFRYEMLALPSNLLAVKDFSTYYQTFFLAALSLI